MLVFINLGTTGYYLTVLTNWVFFFLFQIKNHNQNYKKFIDLIPFHRNQKIISNVTNIYIFNNLLPRAWVQSTPKNLN
jgi:hypothetical protein